MKKIKYSTINCHNENLRDYQIQAKSNILEAWDSCNSVMLQMPTGTGKTVLFTSLINDLLSCYRMRNRNIRILVVAHRNEILDQISKSLRKYKIVHGMIQGSRERNLSIPVQVASIMTVSREQNLNEIQGLDFDFIIVDEAHHTQASTYKKLFNAFPGARKLGVTATPWRLNHESFKKVYDKLIQTPQISWFIKEKYLSDFEYISIKPDSEVQKMVNNTKVSTMGDFVQTELNTTFNNTRIRSKLYKSYKKYAEGRKGIVYAINMEHASRIVNLYKLNCVSAVAIDCKTPKEEREKYIEQFRKGYIKVLVNVDIFSEGFDCPSVSFIQLARPTKSLALYLQQVGRGLRKKEDGEKCIILDNVGLYNYFGLPDANRKWRYHFQGREVVEEKMEKLEDIGISRPKNSILEEDDEEMVVIRRADELLPEGEPVEMEENRSIPVAPCQKQFTLGNYYLLSGTKEDFKVYTLELHDGKPTPKMNVVTCVYEYNREKYPLTFGTESARNLEIFSNDIKLKTIVSLVAVKKRMFPEELMRLTPLDYKRANVEMESEISLFEWLEMIKELPK